MFPIRNKPIILCACGLVSVFWSFGRGKSAGVALFVSPRFSGKISRFLFDSDGRVFSALVMPASRSFNVVNIYAPKTVSEPRTFF